MDLRPSGPSSEEERFWLAQRARLASNSPSFSVPANGGDHKGGDAAAVPAGSGVKVENTAAGLTVISAAGPGARGMISVAATPPPAQAAINPPGEAAESAMAAPASPGVSAAASGTDAGTSRTPGGSKLRPRRRRRIRLRYLIEAWSVSLVVHAAILSALAAATFAPPDVLKKIINFDSALASFSNGEQELLPIYADPDNVPRDRAIGDENASTSGETNPITGDDSDGEDGGGVIVAGGVGSGRPSNTPKLRGVGTGRINDGSSLPGVKVDGLGGSPLTLLPVAPAADLSGGGKIAGDPIFDVKEIGVALDQLAREILRHLKDHKLTVVWLFDESASMLDDQKIISEKFDRVSSELKINVEPSKKSVGALNHAIVGFGQGIDYILEKPREDIDQIGRAIKNLKIDSTGIENTMHAIREVVEHYAGVIRKDRRLLLVLVTDESGDDGADVEEAREALTRYHVPLFVIGRQSLFGYPFAHHRYVDPVTKDVYHPLIRRGPETADLELYQWDGLYDRWDEQPSGFAPYELARLTKDSGGIYFVLPSEEFMRIRQREQAYSITQLKEYLPEYDNRLTYVEKRNSSPMRQLMHAIVVEGKNFIYRRDFPIETPQLVEAALAEGQKASYKLNALLDVQKRLEELSKVRERESEKRWQAHYDLMLAQTVAFQVKAYEYRALMQLIVNSPPAPKGQPSPGAMITWVVNHSKKPLAPSKETAKKYAEAERLLKVVITRHPKTPWADLAQDALDRGFSVQFDEWHHNPNYYNRSRFVPKY